VKARAGAPPPTNGEARETLAGAPSPLENTPDNSGPAALTTASVWPDDPQAERARVNAGDMRIAALQQRAQVAGFGLHVIGVDRVLLTRWRRTRELSVAEAQALFASIEPGACDAQ
jgi:hypothetical protein